MKQSVFTPVMISTLTQLPDTARHFREDVRTYVHKGSVGYIYVHVHVSSFYSMCSFNEALLSLIITGSPCICILCERHST